MGGNQYSITWWRKCLVSNILLQTVLFRAYSRLNNQKEIKTTFYLSQRFTRLVFKTYVSFTSNSMTTYGKKISKNHQILKSNATQSHYWMSHDFSCFFFFFYATHTKVENRTGIMAVARSHMYTTNYT